ncbi:outer membrane protein transport protein [Enterovibrio sp. ZSDZ35]|uniref:Outer membrane protein transport protein n=1 Tax=Enterovibrio qingdaonensis TaxID=2899818 RepID=A0ABT5QJZ8_9GAMM|nr:outer membrane protein transport protein [Enterovibrio sp. ZSDZ35]MDD1781303.1 outer membrane protein transport protein [Enterovibrio sp. ZSDZ35]
MKRVTNRTLLSAAIALATFQAHGAGFQISEHSASGLGRAFAGEAAIADNAAVAVRNPAAMTMFDSAQLSGGISFIQPDVNAKVNTVGSNPASAIPNTSNEHSGVAPDAIVPNVHYVRPLDDKSALGVSVFSNFGLATEYPSDSAAGVIAGQTELTTIDFNVNYAYKITPQWSLGFGLNAVYADASLVRNAGAAVYGANAGTLSALGITSPTDEVTNIKGDGWGFGWNAGVLWEINEKHRLGLSYRSETDITLDGDYRGTSNAQSVLTGGTVPGELELNLPDILEFSGYHKVAPKWAVHYSAMRIGWSSFQELKATSSSCTSTAGAGICLQKDEKWDDSWRYAIGATHYLNNEWTLRAGFAIDESPVPDSHRTLSIPDTERNWYTIGATYLASDNLTIDGGFAYLNGDSVTGSETESGTTFTFEAGGDAYIYSISANYTF